MGVVVLAGFGLWGCHNAVLVSAHALEADPDEPFAAAAAEAARLVPRPERGGPPLVPMASPLPPFGGVSRATATYVGGVACAPCHADHDAVWAGSAHASAWPTLEREAASLRPDCVGCHSTGYLQPTGFRDMSGTRDQPGPATGASALVQVQCESCHGPGSDHVREPGPGYGTLPRSLSACVACHTWETAPDFRFDDAWLKIAH